MRGVLVNIFLLLSFSAAANPPESDVVVWNAGRLVINSDRTVSFEFPDGTLRVSNLKAQAVEPDDHRDRGQIGHPRVNLVTKIKKPRVPLSGSAEVTGEGDDGDETEVEESDREDGGKFNATDLSVTEEESVESTDGDAEEGESRRRRRRRVTPDTKLASELSVRNVLNRAMVFKAYSDRRGQQIFVYLPEALRNGDALLHLNLEEGKGDWKVVFGNSLKVESGMENAPQSGAFMPLALGNGALVFHIPGANVIWTLRFPAAAFQLNGNYSIDTGIRLLPAPAYRQADLTSVGSLYLKRSKRLQLEFQLTSGRKYLLTPPAGPLLDSNGEDTDEEDRSSSSADPDAHPGFVWDLGTDAIRQSLKPSVFERANAQRFGSLKEKIRQWLINPEELVKRDGSDGNAEEDNYNFDAEGVDALMLYGSNELFRHRADTSDQIVLRVTEAINEAQVERKTGAVVYMKFPQQKGDRELSPSRLFQSQFLWNASADVERMNVVILDMSELAEDIMIDGSRRLSSVITQNLDSLAKNFNNIRVIVIQPHWNRTDILNNSRSSLNEELDSHIEWNEHIEILHEMVKWHLRRDIDAHEFEQVVETSARMLGGREQFMAVKDARNAITRAYRAFRGRLSGSEFVENAARYFSRVAGKRIVGPFGRQHLLKVQDLSRRLSAWNSRPVGEALIGREFQLQQTEERVLSWMNGGHKRMPVLPMMFLGDTGTGKTLAAHLVAQEMGAAVRFFSCNSPGKKNKTNNSSSDYDDEDDEFRTSRWLRAAFRDPVTERTDRALERLTELSSELYLDPNPVKVLIVDEIDKLPELFRQLAVAFGDRDRNADGVLNLEGLIVVLTANVDTGSENYQKLNRMRAGDKGLSSLVFDVVKRSMSSRSENAKGSATDEKLVASVAARLLPYTVYFPAIGADGEQQERLVEKVIRDVEHERRAKIVIQPEAREHLRDIAISQSDGNFRAAERSVALAIQAAEARFKILNPAESGLSTGRYYLLALTTDSHGRPALEYRHLDDDKDGIASIIDEELERLFTKIQQVLNDARESFERALPPGRASQIAVQASIRNFQAMENVFRKIKSFKPGNRDVDGDQEDIGFFDDEHFLPTRLSTQQTEALKSLMIRPFENALKQSLGLDEQYRPETIAQPLTDAELLQAIDHANIVVLRLYRDEMQRVGEYQHESEFLNWYNHVYSKYDEQNYFGEWRSNAPEALSALTAMIISDTLLRTSFHVRQYLENRAQELGAERMTQAVNAKAEGDEEITDAEWAHCEAILRRRSEGVSVLDRVFGVIGGFGHSKK